MTPPRLYVILDRSVAGGRDLDAILIAALHGGAEMIQLREKAWPSGLLFPLAQRLRARCRAAGVPFIVNDRVDLAVAVDAELRAELDALTERRLAARERALRGDLDGALALRVAGDGKRDGGGEDEGGDDAERRANHGWPPEAGWSS